MPVAVLVDLDYVRTSPVEMRRSGVGDAISNLTALSDWRLARRVRGEPVDGLAVALAHSGAEAVLSRDGSVDDDDFLVVLGEALVLSGLAMATAGSSRPCSGAEHEIIHAVDQLFPDIALHGELAAVGALFSAHLHDDSELVADLGACLARHGLPRTHRDLGLSDDQFVAAVALAPSTRPDRFTILEHLDLDEEAILNHVNSYADAVAG
jgi:glycerol-1-phosphate dehydrogenase [NAD(P)+]